VSDGRAHPRSFDVVCAGDAVVSVEAAPFRSGPRASFGPGGGAMNAAVGLAARGLRVGLASVLADDRVGRALLGRVAASGVDVSGVERAVPGRGLFLVRGGARQVVPVGQEDQPISIPASWSSQVLLLSGLSPVVSSAGATSRAARAARRAGAVVVVDFDARWELWRGRDPRMMRMILREADVVVGSARDLFGLDVNVQTLRASMRPDAVLVTTDGLRRTSALGAFGEVSRTLEAGAPLPAGDVLGVAVCAELARAGHADARSGALWARALDDAIGLSGF